MTRYAPSPLPSPAANLLAAALNLAAGGACVLPVRPRGKEPLTAHGLHDATTDADQIRAWWAATPAANIGVACRPSGTVVIDVDPRHGGRETLATLEAELGPLPSTATVRTGGPDDGEHRYHVHPGGDLIVSLGPGVDVRSDAYVVAPPSVHPSGGVYEWATGHDVAPAELPPAWVARLRRPEHTPRSEYRPPDGARTGETTVYGHAALEAECRDVAATANGNRNNRLNRAAHALGRLVAGGEIDESEARAELTAAAAACGLPERESGRTIESGISAGMREPRSAPPRQHGPRRGASEPPPGESGDPGTGDTAPVSDRQATRAHWPNPLGSDALHGPVGEFVRLVEAQTEADLAGLVLQYLIAAGCCLGTGPRYMVGGTAHYARLFGVLVGQTARGRKGTAWDLVLRAFGEADPRWSMSCVASGMSTGEGLIWCVRDPRYDIIRKKPRRGPPSDPEEVLADPGVDDKRLLVVESELARALRAADRDGNTLSAVMRLAWDSGNLRVMTRNNPLRATGAHVCIVGHITAEELQRCLTSTEAANGLGNRFLWCAVSRQRLLPDGGNLAMEEVRRMGRDLGDRIASARQVSEMRRSPAARELWHVEYPRLSGDVTAGLLGAITARAEAQVLRLSMIFALLDGAAEIDLPHLRAALEVWRYCEDSARFIFGDSLGDPVADEILRALGAATGGLTRTEIRDLFGRHARSGEIERALAALSRTGRARTEVIKTGGRSAERWHICATVKPSVASVASVAATDKGEEVREETASSSSSFPLSSPSLPSSRSIITTTLSPLRGDESDICDPGVVEGEV